MIVRSVFSVLYIASFVLAAERCCLAAKSSPDNAVIQYQLKTLRPAITDLIETFGPRYPHGRDYLQRLNAVEAACREGDTKAAADLRKLRREALLANPLLDLDGVLLVKRKVEVPQKNGKPAPGWNALGSKAMMALGLPTNHECNTSLQRTGYDNEIAILSSLERPGTLRTLYRPTDGGYVGEIDLHWDADRLLFTESDSANWQVWEIGVDGKDLRRVSQAPDDVDCFDACYMPDGRIVFGSTASCQAVPCWHGQKKVSNLYTMGADGSNVRQVCFDQDHDFHPSILPNGQVLYHRWDYTGINHIFMRQLMVMNPDGTGQRAVYGSNSWFPNALYFPRALPGDASTLVCILSGYHGVHRMGQLVLVDTQRGWYESEGLVKRISGKADPIRPLVRDNLVDKDWPKFLHPYPLSDKHFLVSCWKSAGAPWGIYLADVFDNLVLIYEEPGCALLEPTPIIKTITPPAIPDRATDGSEAVAYLHDVYAGPGLAGVPRGTIKSLRVIAYHFGYPGLAGPDKIGYGGPWEVMRILGTVPLDEDGSVMFRIPAKTPIAVQPLDAEGKAVQLMRSWFTAMPGEVLSCVGCHESPADTASARLANAARRRPRDIAPWRGPTRGFDFAREVQPVLNKHCVICHDGRHARTDLRPEELVADYRGKPLSKLGVSRLHPKMMEDTGGVVKFTPAYDALVAYIRRVSIEDDVSMLTPGEYHADTSELIQLLRKGHRGVNLDAEDWDRIVTWIDLNAPCHGTWGEVYPVPDNLAGRRAELRRIYGGPADDPEAIPKLPQPPVSTAAIRPVSPVRPLSVSGWPVGEQDARQTQERLGTFTRSIDLGNGVTMQLMRIPAGRFVMGDPEGQPDERPLSPVTIDKPFWMGACEVTNEQFRRFDPDHDCRYYQKRHARSDDRGMPLNGSQQPVVRVSWDQAMAFCRWLSERTSMPFTLATEAQWEYACRAGSATSLHYGDVDTNFTRWANVGDLSFADPAKGDYVGLTGGLEHVILEGSALSDRRFDDGYVVTSPVGSLRANVWGLYDMHGNAAEWTRTTYRTYPYRDDGRNGPADRRRKVVRGGSFFDRPARCRSAFRLAYPVWQRVFNVGFRFICEEPPGPGDGSLVTAHRGQ